MKWINLESWYIYSILDRFDSGNITEIGNWQDVSVPLYNFSGWVALRLVR